MKSFFTKVWRGMCDIGGKIGKKNLILIGCVLAVGVAVYINFLLFGGAAEAVDYGGSNMSDLYGSGEQASAGAQENADEYFAATALDRKRAREEAIEVLQTVAESSEALDAAKAKALEDITGIAAHIELEANIETLVKSKGIEDCIAVISGGTVNVIVKSSGLLPSEVAQIYEIVYEQTGCEPANVKIIEKSV